MKKLLIFLILLWLLPIWVFEFLPFVDLPEHLAIARIVHNYHNPDTSIYSRFFTLKFFPKAHILHTLFLHWANFFMPLEIAGKLFLSLIVILLPISIYQFIKAQGGNTWFSLCSFFFIYNYNLMWGFIAYCLGLPVFFFSLTLFLKLNQRQRDILRINLGIALALILAVLLHPYIYLLLLLAFLATGLFAQCNGKKIVKRIFLALPSLIFFLSCDYPLWVERKQLILQDIPSFLPGSAFFKARCQEFPQYLFPGRPPDKVSFWFILTIFIILFFWWSVQAIREKKYNLARKDQAVLFLLSVIILLYLLLPVHLSSSIAVVAPRLAIFIPLLLLGPLSRIKLRGATALLCLTLVALVILFANLIGGFYRFNLQAKPVKRLLQRTEANRRLVQLYTYPQSSPFYFHSFLHFDCYYTIWRNGLCGFLFPQMYPHHILELKEGITFPWINAFEAWDSIFPQGWENFDYFLVYGQPTPEQEKMLKDADKLHLIDEEGIWRLYGKVEISKRGK